MSNKPQQKMSKSVTILQDILYFMSQNMYVKTNYKKYLVNYSFFDDFILKLLYAE